MKTGTISVLLAVGLTIVAACSPSIIPNPSASLDLPREVWYGGPSYYSKFANAAASGWTDPSFFPISVFYGKPEHAATLKAAGINIYMGAEHDGSTIDTITNTGMAVIAQSEWTPAEIGNDKRVVGWMLSDECDIGYSGCSGDEYARLAKQKEYAAAARGRNDGRFVQANFGNGVLGTYWSPNTMAAQVGLMDVTSVDKYAYTSPEVDAEFARSPYWTSGVDPDSALAYGWQEDRMESYMSPAASKPNWVFVETAMPYLNETGARTIQVNQIEGAVWEAIIHGAAGIAYFQHNNNGVCGNDSIVDCPNVKAKVTAIDAQVASLAKVINTQTYSWNFGAGLDTSLKVSDGYAYIFAMPTGGTGSRTFTLPAGIRGASVEVVDENRTVPTSNNTFTDTFAAEYTHHIYRIVI